MSLLLIQIDIANYSTHSCLHINLTFICMIQLWIPNAIWFHWVVSWGNSRLCPSSKECCGGKKGGELHNYSPHRRIVLTGSTSLSRELAISAEMLSVSRWSSIPSQSRSSPLRISAWESSSADLRKAAGIADRAEFNKALDELQNRLKVVPADVLYEPKFTYIWTLAEELSVCVLPGLCIDSWMFMPPLQSISCILQPSW